jgi:hypothetical protein
MTSPPAERHGAPPRDRSHHARRVVVCRASDAVVSGRPEEALQSGTSRDRPRPHQDLHGPRASRHGRETQIWTRPTGCIPPSGRPVSPDTRAAKGRVGSGAHGPSYPQADPTLLCGHGPGRRCPVARSPPGPEPDLESRWNPRVVVVLLTCRRTDGTGWIGGDAPVSVRYVYQLACHEERNGCGVNWGLRSLPLVK